MLPARNAESHVFLADRAATYFAYCSGGVLAAKALGRFVPDHLTRCRLHDLPVGLGPSSKLYGDNWNVEQANVSN